MLVPATCLTCELHVVAQGGCCPACWSKMRFVSRPFCPVMGTPFSIDMGDAFLSAEAIANPPPFERMRTVMLYDDLARRLIASLKYADRTDLIPWISKWMAVAGKELIEDADVIIPVPLHKSRLHSRRFNQACEFSRLIAKDSDKDFKPEYLIRKRATKQQVGLTESQRKRNVSGAFTVPQEMKPNLKAKRVLLIDDVYTTGATVKAATKALKRAGADQVCVLVFAKVETHLT